MDVHTKEQRSKNMRAIKARNTKIENLLSKALWHRGIRFRKNSNSVYGKPDISIKKWKIAVFCDSEFWHGKDWDSQKKRIGTNKEFWDKKISGNIERDKVVNETLRNKGWVVMRFWGKEIISDPENCAEMIIHQIDLQKEKLNTH